MYKLLLRIIGVHNVILKRSDYNKSITVKEQVVQIQMYNKLLLRIIGIQNVILKRSYSGSCLSQSTPCHRSVM